LCHLAGGEKDAFYFYNANWTKKPMAYIASRRHVQCTQPLTEIKVYSNYDHVELKVNGKVYGAAVVFTRFGVVRNGLAKPRKSLHWHSAHHNNKDVNLLQLWPAGKALGS